MTLDQFKQQLAEMKKAKSFILLPDCGEYVRWRANFPYQEDDIHVIEAPENWLSIIEKLEIAIEALEYVAQPFVGDVDYVDSAVRKQEKAWHAIRKIVGGEND